MWIQVRILKWQRGPRQPTAANAVVGRNPAFEIIPTRWRQGLRILLLPRRLHKIRGHESAIRRRVQFKQRAKQIEWFDVHLGPAEAAEPAEIVAALGRSECERDFAAKVVAQFVKFFAAIRVTEAV